MKNILTSLIFFCFLGSMVLSPGCKKSKVKHLASTVKVKDIQVTTRIDTISYALGTLWAMNLLKYGGLNNISYAFYLGVNDYLKKDSSLMNVPQAVDYSNKNLARLKSGEEWPVPNNDIRLCDLELKSKYDTFSYCLGYGWTNNAYGIGISELSPALLKGLTDRLKGDTTIFKDYMKANNYLMTYVEELRLAKYADVKKANDAWLAENAKKEGVVTLASGVQYKIVKSGKGKKMVVNDNDIIETYYTSKLPDGSIYENYSTEPFKVYVFATLKGLNEAIKLMKEGDKWEIFIPYNLAYGSGGVNGKVPPFSALEVDLEILKISKN